IGDSLQPVRFVFNATDKKRENSDEQRAARSTIDGAGGITPHERELNVELQIRSRFFCAYRFRNSVARSSLSWRRTRSRTMRVFSALLLLRTASSALLSRDSTQARCSTRSFSRADGLSRFKSTE